MGVKMKPMKRGKSIISVITEQRGTVIVYVGILILVLIGFAALAVDIGHLYVARNELQNAADAGALAGAQVLYNADGTAVNPNANQTALAVATANLSQNSAVEVIANLLNNSGDIERGHWSFTTRQFTRSEPDNLSPPQLWDYTTLQLDTMTTFVNAVRVRTGRETTPVALTFARIFGFSTYPVSAEAIAYLGFAGSLLPHGVDQPIATCLESLLNADGSYTCENGRMFTSSSVDCATNNSATWTDLSQENACEGGNSLGVPEMRGLINGGSGNPTILTLGLGLNTNGGVQNATYMTFRNRWENETNRIRPWPMTLPVIKCEQAHQNLNDCAPIWGAVELNILWVSRWGEGGVSTDDYADFPTQFTNVPGYPDWSTSTADGETRWREFAQWFHLKDLCGNPVQEILQKTIYFLPDCSPHPLQGTTGGQNFGILAKIPVLVAPPQN